MKKVLGVALAAVLVLGVGSAAMAWWGGPGMGYGYGMGYSPQGQAGGWGPGAMMGARGGWGPGGGFGPGAGPCWGWNRGATGVNATTIDEAKAKEIATDYVSKNLPGYNVEKLVRFERPRGPMYQVEVKGPKGEVGYLTINPFGYVMPLGTGRPL